MLEARSVTLAAYRHARIAAAAAVGLLLACGGDDGIDLPVAAQAASSPPAGPALEGQRVADRDAALQIVARGVVAPLHFSDLAHAVLARTFEARARTQGSMQPASYGDRWTLLPDGQALGSGGAVLEGPVAIEIEAADHALGLMLRGEAGSLRAHLRFEQVALGTGGRVDGEIVLEVSRTAAGAGLSRRSQADRLTVTDGSRTLHWSYLAVDVDARQVVQALTVVADTTVDGSQARAWIDVTAAEPVANSLSQRYRASGVIGFLDAYLTSHLSADGSLTIDVDNGKDDRVDFVAQASAAEVRALMLGL